MFSKYTQWIIYNPYKVLLLSFLLVAGCGYGMTKIVFDQDYKVFFSDDYPQLKALTKIQQTYNKNDNILFVIESRSGTIFNRETLAAVKEITQKAWQTPYSIRVESLTNFQYTRAENDNVRVSDLVIETDTLSIDNLQKIQAVALSDPMLLNRLISEDGKVTGINILVELPGKSTAEAPAVMDFARNLSAEIEKKYPDLRLYLTGIIPMNHAFPEASMKDMGTLVPGMYLVIFIFSWFLLRSFWGTLSTFIMITFSVVCALGISGLLGIHLTPPSASTPTMIMTLAVADTIHFLTYMFHELRTGKSKKMAISESLRVNFQPMFLTSIATVIGFLSMNFSDSPPFRDLGNITAIGVMAAFFFSVSFLPALMTVLPVKAKQTSSWIDRFVISIADFVIYKRRLLSWMMVAVIIVLASFIPKIELNDEWVDYFDESYAFHNDTIFAADNLTGVYTIEYSIPSQGSEGITDPQYLQQLNEFVEWFRSQPEVIHVSAVTDLFKRINMNLHDDNQQWYRLPTEKIEASQYLLLYEMSLPFGQDLNNMIDVDHSATRVLISLDNISTVEMKQIEFRAEQWMKANLAQHMFSHGSSATIMFTHISQQNIRQMLIATSVALVVISLVLIVALKSLKLGLLSLVPNLVPAIMGFGLWGMLVGEVGLAVSIVSAMTLGIVVDDTIHFLSKFSRAQKEKGLSAEQSVRYAFSSVGVAMVTTTILLVAGFLVLSQSTFAMNSQMGALTAITIAIALIADFLFLPALLMATSEKQTVLNNEALAARETV